MEIVGKSKNRKYSVTESNLSYIKLYKNFKFYENYLSICKKEICHLNKEINIKCIKKKICVSNKVIFDKGIKKILTPNKSNFDP